MTHIAIVEQLAGRDAQWMEKVSTARICLRLAAEGRPGKKAAGSFVPEDRLGSVAVRVCGVFGGAVFQPSVQFAAAGGVQETRGGEITAHGLGHSAATILLNHVGKDLREIQELLRHKNIRTTVHYTLVGYKQTRQTVEALSQALE
jgi:integrase